MPSPEDMEAELKWLVHNQAALDQRLARVEDSLVFRTLRAIGRLYLKKAGGSRGYAEWVKRAGMDAAPAVALREQPLITVRVTVRRPVRALLERAVASVKAQTYRRWELVGDVDPGAPQWARDMFSGAATGEWVAHLGENDFLSPVALEHFAAAVQDGDADLVYSDADVVDGAGLPHRPLFKPDWSPVLLRSVDYLGGLRMERVGLSGAPGKVVHVPRVLYHCGETLPHGRGSDGVPATHRADTVLSRDREGAFISIVICSRNAALLRRCLAGIRGLAEVIVVQHITEDALAVAAVIEEFGAKRVAFAKAFNFSEMNNLGARAATGEVLLFLNDDVVPIAADWLGRMVRHLEDPTVGAVGAKLVYPSGAIQHAGIATWLIDGAGHPGRNLIASDNWPWLNYTREVTAVTGACLAIRRADFERLGGFDPVFPVNYNDVDLCLRLRAAGLSVIFEANAVLRHDESQTRRPGTQYDERRLFFRRWAHVVEKVDPYYSPHLAQNNEDLSLR